MSQAFVVTDRSGVATFHRCERAYYLQRHSGVLDAGIEPVGRRLWALIGSACHRGVTRAILAGSVDGAARDAINWLRGTLAVRPFIVTRHGEPLQTLPQNWPSSGLALVDAIVRYWYRTRWPAYEAHFSVRSIERPDRWTIDDATKLEVQPDVLLVNHESGKMYPLDFKFTTRISEYWIRQWACHPQVVSYCATYGQKIAGMIIEGVDRGDVRNGIFTSPLISGYVSGSAIGVSDVSQLSRTRLDNRQRRVMVPFHQIRAWGDTAPGFLFARSVELPPPSEEQVGAYADLVRRQVGVTNARLSFATPIDRWPMTGIVTGECAGVQHTCPYASTCYPGRFPAVPMQSRDPHHNPYQDEDVDGE
jgi:PD-(D/E)XK nuclease superfamily